MAQSPDDTQALVLRARSGDREAYAALVARFENGVFGHMLSVTGDAERSAELTQEALTTAYFTLDRLQKPASFRAWVIGIGLNLARRKRREVASPELLGAAAEKRQEGAEAMARREKIAAVRRAIAELPENYRDALLLHYFDKQRGRQIGEELGISEGAVHMTLLRARRALAEKLKAFAPE